MAEQQTRERRPRGRRTADATATRPFADTRQVRARVPITIPRGWWVGCLPTYTTREHVRGRQPRCRHFASLRAARSKGGQQNADGERVSKAGEC